MATYQIKYGDTLSQIAKDNGTTVAELAQLNGIANPNVIRAGQTINLPDKAPAASAQQSAAQQTQAAAPAQTESPIKGVSQEVYNQMSQQYTPDQKVNDAWAAIEQLQQKLNGGTKYGEQLDSLVQDILNRPAFQYKVEEDALFQQMLASSKKEGEKAMEDTIARSSALTGGYGNSWAQTAGQQAYDQYLQGAYDQLPQYYQLALNAHQMESDELAKKYSLLSTEDQKEFDRLMSEIGLAYDAYQTLSAEDRAKYEDSIGIAQQLAAMMSSDYWNQLTADFQKEQFEYQKQQDAIANSLARAKTYSGSSDDDKLNDLMENYLSGIKEARKRYTNDNDFAKYLDSLPLSEAEISALLGVAGITANLYDDSKAKAAALAEIDKVGQNLELSSSDRQAQKSLILNKYANSSFYNDLVQRFRYYRI